MKRMLFALLLTAITLPPLAAGAQPNNLTLQGVLRAADGGLVSGEYDMTFRFYAAQDAPDAVFTASLAAVPVDKGVYAATVQFGQSQPALDNDALWLGIAVDGQEEYPRVPLTSVLYARRAAWADAAGGLTCTGCIQPGMLDFQPVTPTDLAQGDLVVGGTVTAAAFVGDGSGLTGITSPQGSCADGWFVAGIDPDGALQCQEIPTTVTSVDGLDGGTISGDVAVTGLLTAGDFEVCTLQGNCGETLAQLACLEGQAPVYNGEMWTCSDGPGAVTPEMLPPDGLNEVSNDLLNNQFTDTYASTGIPVDIKDFYPPGVSDQLVVPDAGIAQALTVSVNITNSDLSTVDVFLYDPEGVEYVLYQKNGPGTELGATFPVPTEPISGDLTTWVGKNPKGTWILKVVDSGFMDTEFDGQVNAWSIQVQTLSTQKVQVAGDLEVNGNIVSAGGDGLTIDDAGNVSVAGDLTVGGALNYAIGLDCTTVSNNSGGSDSSVSCPNGYTMVGGGCAGTPGPNGYLYNSYPSGNGWYCLETSTSVTAYARCCRLSY